MGKSGEFSARWRGEGPASRGGAGTFLIDGKGKERRPPAECAECFAFPWEGGGFRLPLWGNRVTAEGSVLPYRRKKRSLLCAAVREKGTFRLFPMRRGRKGFAFPWRCEKRESRFLCAAARGKETFRLFPMRGGELTACGAVNIAAAHWKFARKLARPPSCVRVTWAQSGRFRPCCFPVRAGGVTDGGFGQFAVLLPGSGVRSVEPRPFLFAERAGATAGSARTRQGTLGSLDSPFAAASSDEPSFRLGA